MDPVRVVLGGDAAIVLLKIIRSIAKEGRHIREQRAISNAMAEIASDQLADEDDPSEEAIRDG